MGQRLLDDYVRYPPRRARTNRPRTYQSPKRPTGAPCAPGLPAAGTGTAVGTTAAAAGAAASGTTAPCARKPHARQQDESPGSQAWALVIVELGGFEPPTSSMPWKRATNCAIAPRWASTLAGDADNCKEKGPHGANPHRVRYLTLTRGRPRSPPVPARRIQQHHQHRPSARHRRSNTQGSTQACENQSAAPRDGSCPGPATRTSLPGPGPAGTWCPE